MPNSGGPIPRAKEVFMSEQQGAGRMLVNAQPIKLVKVSTDLEPSTFGEPIFRILGAFDTENQRATIAPTTLNSKSLRNVDSIYTLKILTSGVISI